MVKHINIGKLEFTFVFRYRYEKDSDDHLLDQFTMWNKWELGFFYKRMSAVSRKNFSRIKEWNKNLVYMHMLGINLLWIKMWVTVDRGAMHLSDD